MQAYTHFRAVFDVEPVGQIANPWPALIGEVRAWVSRKERAELKGWFFSGGTWSGQTAKRARVDTRTFSESVDAPDFWAMRYEHLDEGFSARRWTTDIGVTRTGPRSWRMSAHLMHRLRPDYVGKELAPPEPSSPRLIKGLLESKNWACRVGSVELVASPKAMAVGRGHEFAQLLRDPQRLVPLVLASCDRRAGVPKIDCVRLSWALAGTAVVYVCESPECDDELEHLVPMRFRCPNGMVRIYAPGVDFAQDWSSVRHRFFSPREVDDLGDDEVISQIVRALTRSDAWRGLQATVTSIDDIDARIRDRRLEELRSSRSGSQEEISEMLRLFEAENARLEKEKREWVELAEAESLQRREVEDSLARREYDLEQAQASAAEARTEATASREGLKSMRDLDALPTELTAIAQLAVKVFGDKVVLTSSAMKALENSEFGRCAESRDVLWRCLKVMSENLQTLMTQKLSANQIADQFKAQTKFDLTWTEGQETKKDNKLMAKRRFVHNGQELDMTPHVKWGNKAPRLLRVHFCVDPDTKQLVVGHCGDHLDTVGTRRRG